MVEDTRAVAERFWAAHERGDPDALAAELHDDVVVYWPQSGERIRGKANLDAINRALPGGHPKGSLVHLQVQGELAILEMKLVYGTEVAYVVELLEIAGGKVIRAREYFAAPFDAPVWRRLWVEAVDRT
jgi:ketosteroid isomerase-like protein